MLIQEQCSSEVLCLALLETQKGVSFKYSRCLLSRSFPPRGGVNTQLSWQVECGEAPIQNTSHGAKGLGVGKSGTSAEGTAAAEPQFTRGRSLINGLQVFRALAGEPQLSKSLVPSAGYSLSLQHSSQTPTARSLRDHSFDYFLSSWTLRLQMAIFKNN